MNAELKSLIEDAAGLLGLHIDKSETNGGGRGNTGFDILGRAVLDWDNMEVFDPCDPERGDLEKLMDAAELVISYSGLYVEDVCDMNLYHFTKGDHPSKVLAVLRAASAVYKSRGGV